MAKLFKSNWLIQTSVLHFYTVPFLMIVPLRPAVTPSSLLDKAQSNNYPTGSLFYALSCAKKKNGERKHRGGVRRGDLSLLASSPPLTQNNPIWLITTD